MKNNEDSNTQGKVLQGAAYVSELAARAKKFQNQRENDQSEDNHSQHTGSTNIDYKFKVLLRRGIVMAPRCSCPLPI